MASEAENGPCSTPKLSFLLLPNKPSEPPGLPTPPLCTSASVPFMWEEAPGKPRACATAIAAIATSPKSRIARRLDLPPRLLTDQTKVANMSSPSTVLEGPYAGQSLSHTLSSLLKKRSSGSPEGGLAGGRSERKERWSFSSWRWGSFKEGNSDFSASVDGSAFENDRKVKITRVRRGRSFLGFSHTGPNLLSSMYGSFKQAIPWGQSRGKQRKMSF